MLSRAFVPHSDRVINKNITKSPRPAATGWPQLCVTTKSTRHSALLNGVSCGCRMRCPDRIVSNRNIYVLYQRGHE